LLVREDFIYVLRQCDYFPNRRGVKQSDSGNDSLRGFEGCWVVDAEKSFSLRQPVDHDLTLNRELDGHVIQEIRDLVHLLERLPKSESLFVFAVGAISLADGEVLQNIDGTSTKRIMVVSEETLGLSL